MGQPQVGLRRRGLQGPSQSVGRSCGHVLPFSSHLIGFILFLFVPRFFFFFSPASLSQLPSAYLPGLAPSLDNELYIFPRREGQALGFLPTSYILGRKHKLSSPPPPHFPLISFLSFNILSSTFVTEEGQINKLKPKLCAGHKVRTSGRLARKFACLSGFRLHILCCLVTGPTISFHALFSLSLVYSVITTVTS